jgi:hypothetical protein
MIKLAGIVAAAVCFGVFSAPAPATAQISFGFGIGPSWDGYDGSYYRPYYRRHLYQRHYYNNDYDSRYDNDDVYGYGGDDHVTRCEARYRSYDADTDMFLGYDGNYHYCRL